MTEDNDLTDPDSDILNQVGLARLLHISAASICTLRSRDPIKLPPPFTARPLRWRREAVLAWMAERERREQQRIESSYHPNHPGRAPMAANGALARRS